MGQSRSPDEYRAELVAQLGEKQGSLLYEVDNDFTWLFHKWNDYDRLFGGPSNVKLLNKVAPAFFGALQQTLLEDVILHLCRLTDPRTVNGNETLSIEQLRNIGDTALRRNLKKILKDIHRKAAFARKHRNRRLAHNDLSVVRGDDKLPGFSRADVRAVLRAIAELFNAIKTQYRGGPTAYESTIGPLGGTEALLDALTTAAEVRDTELKQLRNRAFPR